MLKARPPPRGTVTSSLARPETIPPWDRLAQGPSHLPLSAIPQTKYMCREREAWPHHRWPAPGPSHLGTDLLKARPPPRGTHTRLLCRPRDHPSLGQACSRPVPPTHLYSARTPQVLVSTRHHRNKIRTAPLPLECRPLCALDSRRPRPHCPPLRGSGARRLPLARPHKTRANGIWDSQAVTDLGTNQTRLRFTAGS